MQENVGTLVTAQHVWSPFYVDDMIETDTNPDVTSSQSNGSVDTSFGTNTTAHTTTTSLTSSPTSAKSAADGSDILVAAMVGSTPELLFYNSSGGLDTAYGSGTGIVSLSFTGWTAITGIVVQSDGDIDLAVTTSSGGMNIAQLNDDGSADTVFGSAGVETLSSLPAAKGIVLAPNGDLLVAGLSTATFKVAELNPTTGSQDTSYNTSGTASIVSNSNGSTVIYIGMALMPDGDLLLSGRYVTSGPPTRYYLAMVAITPTGVGDSSFGTSGGVSGRYTQEWDNPFTPGDTPMVVSPTGQIFIGYASASVGHQFLAVFEFNPNGSLNTSFGDDGIASANLSSGTTNIVLAIETNGQIVIGDGSGSGTFNLVRFNPSGTLDTTFGSSGVESGASESGGLAMVTAANGETVMVGTPPSGTTGIILQEFHTLANAQRVYVEQDADYNVTSITDTSGNVVERYEYDPYGNVTVLNPNGTVIGAGMASSFYAEVVGYQGGWTDPVTGLVHFGARDLNTGLGRWIQQDPAGYVNGANRYQFEMSRSPDGVDPTGSILHILDVYTGIDTTVPDSQLSIQLPPNHHDWSGIFKDYNPPTNVPYTPPKWEKRAVWTCRVIALVSLAGAAVVGVLEAGGATAAEDAAGSGRVFYGTPQGQLIEAPPGYEPVTAQNGQGLVLQPEGQTLGDNSNIIRYGDPNAQNPDGYFRYYNDQGQPLNPATGQPGPNSATHIPPNYQGPLNGYPGR